MQEMNHIYNQGCNVVSSQRFLVGVGFLTTLGVGVRYFCPTLTPDVQLDIFYIKLLIQIHIYSSITRTRV